MGKYQHYVIVVDAKNAKKVIKMFAQNVRAVVILVLVDGKPEIRGKLGSIVRHYGATVMKGYLPLPT